MIFILAVAGWLLVGAVVVEACRLWRVWWLNPLDVPTLFFWPVILFFTVRNGPDQ